MLWRTENASIGISVITPCVIVNNIVVVVDVVDMFVAIRVVAVATSVIVITDVDTDAHWTSNGNGVVELVVGVGHVVGVCALCCHLVMK